MHLRENHLEAFTAAMSNADGALETLAIGDSSAALDTAARKRPRAGERRTPIPQALAAMLEQPGVDRVATAALATRLQVSGAAL